MTLRQIRWFVLLWAGTMAAFCLGDKGIAVADDTSSATGVLSLDGPWLLATDAKNVGGEGVFTLDVTDAIKPDQKNTLAVRVLNPTNEPIDGITLAEVPRRCKSVPFYAGGLYNDGGIVDSVELLLAPAVRLTNLKLDPDPKTGEIHVQAVSHNASAKNVKANLECTAAPSSAGETLQSVRLDRELIPDLAWMGQDAPAEAVAGATNTSQGYNAGLFVLVNSLGAGQFLLNTLHIRENIGRNPAADRLLINMLQYAASNAHQLLANLPADFDVQLKAMGY